MKGNGEQRTGNVERRAEKGEQEADTESTSEIGSSKVRSLQLSHVVSSVTLSRLFVLVLILNFLSVSFFFLFPYLFTIFVKFIMSPKVH